jgi:hypothetical protein
MEGGTCCSALMRTGQLTLVGRETMNVLSPTETTLPTQECPFDDHARYDPGQETSDSSTTLGTGVESGCGSSSWSPSGSLVVASYVRHAAGTTPSDLNSSAPLKSKAGLYPWHGCDDYLGSSVSAYDGSARQTC